jgi:hypothetical protein
VKQFAAARLPADAGGARLGVHWLPDDLVNKFEEVVNDLMP